MKTFEITYRMSVHIEAKTQQEAQKIFENENLTDLSPEYIEQISIEELTKQQFNNL